MKLYDIDKAFRDWGDRISANDGEVSEADIQELNELNALAEDKIDAYSVLIKESLSEADILAQEAEKLLARAKRKKNLAERLKGNLDYFMRSQGKEKFSSLKSDISYRTSVALKIEEDVKLAKKWLKVETKPDKVLIKDFLKAGGKIKGCLLVENKNIQIK